MIRAPLISAMCEPFELNSRPRASLIQPKSTQYANMQTVGFRRRNLPFDQSEPAAAHSAYSKIKTDFICGRGGGLTVPRARALDGRYPIRFSILRGRPV